MKIRSGFVSNSSTTSFAIYGVKIHGEEKVFKMLGGIKEKSEPEVCYECKHEFDRKNMKFCPDCGRSSKPIVYEDEDIDYYEEILELARKNGLYAECDYENGDYYIGVDLNKRYSKEKKITLVSDTNAQLEKFTKLSPDFHFIVIEGG